MKGAEGWPEARIRPMYLLDEEFRDIYRTIGNVGSLSRAFCSECGCSVALAVCQCPGSRQLLRIRGGRGAVEREKSDLESTGESGCVKCCLCGDNGKPGSR
ncbi:uncharacterized protein LOC123503558 isoform X2 [Portunus trituberculatus]|uniref:uncharacterized protein LOC123503558 isoform X2 n=1 Tax=Portunus trituberculatus TaxID=210409 RepID=UPI001E1D14BD|nr:uncharacterized protein LOC123503558 isoform X2 [Portunus trituberculatus]